MKNRIGLAPANEGLSTIKHGNGATITDHGIHRATITNHWNGASKEVTA
jgi:hypothetical protein